MSPDDAQQQDDEWWLEAALKLARGSVGLASPNPMVGCILVKDGVAIGEGRHEYEKRDHAEIVALAKAGERAAGATAYVTLEPCSHHGRTGPCADALIRAGTARVVVSTVDPNPMVSGRGLAKLRAAGVEVKVSEWGESARELNDPFAKYIRTGLPLVTLKAALSLDGRIAPAPQQRTAGTPVWITGEESRRKVQELRHASDALITGINTVLDDDPLLTDRTGLPRRRPLLRVVLDSELRLALRLDSKLVKSAEGDVMVFCTTGDEDRRAALIAAGVRVEQIEADPGPSAKGSGRVSLPRAIARLGQMQMLSVMIEAGAQVNTTAFEQGVVDRLFLFYGPVTLGASGVPFLYGVEDRILADGFFLSNLFKLARVQPHRFGVDAAYEASRGDLWEQGPEAFQP